MPWLGCKVEVCQSQIRHGRFTFPLLDVLAITNHVLTIITYFTFTLHNR
jgi:hypothetical protein